MNPKRPRKRVKSSNNVRNPFLGYQILKIPIGNLDVTRYTNITLSCGP
jgi:hypothetical protein